MSYQWSEEDMRRARGWYESGASYFEIAKRLGRTASAVEMKLRKMRVPKATQGYFAGDRGWTPAEKERLARLWDAGVAKDRICKILGRSAKAVSTMASVMQLGRRPRIAAREDHHQPTGDPLSTEVCDHERMIVVPAETYRVVRDAARREGLSIARWLIMIAKLEET